MFRKTLIVGIAAIGMLAVGGTALAEAPPLEGTLTLNDSANPSSDASPIGTQSSAIRQNGQFVSSRTSSTAEWANQKGHRSDMVQAAARHGRAGHQPSPDSRSSDFTTIDSPRPALEPGAIGIFGATNAHPGQRGTHTNRR